MTTQTKKKHSPQMMAIWSIVVILAVLLGGYAFTEFKKNETEAQHQARAMEQHDAYIESLMKKNPGSLREKFLNDIDSGVNDEFTRSAALWIMHRYFDNGGDVYEIRDFIASKPELTFLNTEGSKINTEYWAMLENGTTPHSYSTRAKMVLLAWLEVLDEHGYGGIAMHGMLAHHYAYENLYSLAYPGDFPKSFDHKKFRKDQSEKALKYLEKMSPEVEAVLSGKTTPRDVPARDIMLGLSEYGAAIRYLQVAGVTFTPQHDPMVVFDHAAKLAATDVQELYFFTNHLNASTYVLTMAEGQDAKELARIVYPFTSMRINRKPGGIIDRILESRTQTYEGFDLYTKTNMVRIAHRVPEYKKWLMANGWVESDFK